MNEQVRRFGGKAMSEVGETIRFLAGVVAVWFVLGTRVPLCKKRWLLLLLLSQLRQE